MQKNRNIEDLLNSKFLNTSKFSMDIENLVRDSSGSLNYIDAIVTYCEENDIEIESITKLLSKPLKEKLKADAQRMNFIKKSSNAKLPI